MGRKRKTINAIEVGVVNNEEIQNTKFDETEKVSGEFGFTTCTGNPARELIADVLRITDQYVWISLNGYAFAINKDSIPIPNCKKFKKIKVTCTMNNYVGDRDFKIIKAEAL